MNEGKIDEGQHRGEFAFKTFPSGFEALRHKNKFFSNKKNPI